MMSFVLAYREAIDKATADKVLKLRKYELNNEDWIIIKDLVSVLEVHQLFKFYSSLILLHYRPTRRQHFFSQLTQQALQQLHIPAMDELDNHPNPHIKNPYHPAIQAAIMLTQKKLNCYYSLTDLLSVY